MIVPNKNDMTKDEYRAVLRAKNADSDEESKSAEELINEYGTYEIQPTADTGNVFPAIAQGLSKAWDFDREKKSAHATRNRR